MAILVNPPRPDYTGAAALVSRLGADLTDARTRLGLTPAVQAKQIGITTSTLTRLSAGSVPTRTTILAGLRWLANHGGA